MADVLKAAWFLDNPKVMQSTLDSLVVNPLTTWVIPSAAAQGVQVTRQVVVDQLTAWVASFTAPKLILFTGNPTLGPDISIDDLNEPTGSWYAQKVIAFNEVFDGTGSNLFLGTDSKQWNYSGVDPAETITGAAIIDVTV